MTIKLLKCMRNRSPKYGEFQCYQYSIQGIFFFQLAYENGLNIGVFWREDEYFWHTSSYSLSLIFGITTGYPIQVIFSFRYYWEKYAWIFTLKMVWNEEKLEMIWSVSEVKMLERCWAWLFTYVKVWTWTT